MAWILKETKAQFFLECLFKLLALADRPCLRLVAEGFGDGLTISLVINNVESTGIEVADGFFACS